LKAIGLKKIAQRLLVCSEPAKHRGILPELKVENEIQSLHFGQLPLLAGRKHHVCLTPSELSFGVRCSLLDLFASNEIQCSIAGVNLDTEASPEAERQEAIAASCALLMPLDASVMSDEQLHSDLRFAQQSGVKIIMLHVHQASEGPEDNTFAQVMGNCPDDISDWLFNELAVDWHLDEDFEPVGQHLVWQRLAAACSGDQETIKTGTSKKRGAKAPASQVDRPIQAKEVELTLADAIQAKEVELTLADKATDEH
jgi:hypothetical protein